MGEMIEVLFITNWRASRCRRLREDGSAENLFRVPRGRRRCAECTYS
jgi:hypothetical protein